MIDAYKLKSRKDIALERYDPDDTAGIESKEQIEADFDALKVRLEELQNKLYAGRQHSVLIVIQGMDCSGKDGLVLKAFAGLHPQGFRAESFKRPTEEEAAHDFLWRSHRVTPAKGSIVSFIRSYYEDALITRVHGMISRKEAFRRLVHMRQFEKMLADSGTVLIKLFLHISPEFQLRKLRERQADPAKRWKFDPNDLEERKHWDAYMAAYEDAFRETSTKRNPWHVVPANHRWFRDYLALSIVVARLEKLGLSYPVDSVEGSGEL